MDQKGCFTYLGREEWGNSVWKKKAEYKEKWERFCRLTRAQNKDINKSSNYYLKRPDKFIV